MVVVLHGRGLAILSVVIIAYVFSFITVLLRCYARLKIMKFFGWDDALMVIALLFDVLFVTCSIGSTMHGGGKKFAELSPYHIKQAMIYWYIGQTGYILTCTTVKLSISIFLLRITISRVHAWILYGVMAATVAMSIVVMFTVMLQCQPVSSFWDKTSGKGTCLDKDLLIGMIYFFHVVSAICDFTIGLLPVTLVWNTSFNRKTKVAIVSIMGMGCIASAACVARIPYVKGYKEKDFLYHTIGFVICSHIELALGISAGSLATLRPLIRRICGSTSSRSQPDSHTRDSQPSSNYYKQGHNLLDIISRTGERGSGNTTLSADDTLDADAVGGHALLDLPSSAHREGSTNTNDLELSRRIPGSAGGSHTTEVTSEGRLTREYTTV